jgi:hypothetical protein
MEDGSLRKGQDGNGDSFDVDITSWRVEQKVKRCTLKDEWDGTAVLKDAKEAHIHLGPAHSLYEQLARPHCHTNGFAIWVYCLAFCLLVGGKARVWAHFLGGEELFQIWSRISWPLCPICWSALEQFESETTTITCASHFVVWNWKGKGDPKRLTGTKVYR